MFRHGPFLAPETFSIKCKQQPPRSVTADPHGSFEERCAWMRARQAAKALHTPKVKTGANTGQDRESKG
jgi:hypothetical protein